MKYAVTLFWGVILAQVAAFLGTSLSNSSYNPVRATILGVVMSVGVILLQKFIPLKAEKHDE